MPIPYVFIYKKVRPQKGLTFAYSHGIYKSCYYWKSTKDILYTYTMSIFSYSSTLSVAY